jgi:hypothetical protein
MLPSRKQRREMARKFGLVKKDMNFKEWSAQLSRSIKAGQIIHQKNLQDQHNRQLKAQEDVSEKVDIEIPDTEK